MAGWPPPLRPPSPPSPPPPPTGTDDDELEALSVTQAVLIACVIFVSTVTVTFLCAQRCPRAAAPTLSECGAGDDPETATGTGTSASVRLSVCSAVRPLSPSELGPAKREWPAVAARLLSRASGNRTPIGRGSRL